MVGDQKWEIVEITIGTIFLAWDAYSRFFIPKVFKSPPPKVPIPAQNPNLT